MNVMKQPKTIKVKETFLKNALLFIIVSWASSLGFAQSQEKVQLQWKIGEKETVVYKTLMKEIDSSSFEVDFGNLFDGMGDSISTESKNFLSKIQDSFNDIDLVSMLSSDDEVVKIEMKTVDKEKSEKKKKKDDEIDLHKLMSSLNDGVVLRGSVYKNGGIESFWVKTNQKNLLALFFELPKGEIKIGDSWELEVNFINNDQNFECDSAFRKNNVSLIDLKIVDGDTLAVLKYDIEEYVSGNFNSPFSEESKKTKMLMTHKAIGEFSISKGRWASYNGIMTLIASGFMSSNSKQSFSLVEIE